LLYLLELCTQLCRLALCALQEARRAAPRDEEYIVVAPAAIEKKVFALSEYE
jgi:hypothetical protein